MNESELSEESRSYSAAELPSNAMITLDPGTAARLREEWISSTRSSKITPHLEPGEIFVSPHTLAHARYVVRRAMSEARARMRSLEQSQAAHLANLTQMQKELDEWKLVLDRHAKLLQELSP